MCAYRTTSGYVTSDIKIPTKVQIEHIMPLSKIKVVCQKENYCDFLDATEIARLEEEKAKQREAEKREKAQNFLEKTKDNSKLIILDKAKEKKRLELEKQQENSRILKKIEKKRIEVPSKSSNISKGSQILTSDDITKTDEKNSEVNLTNISHTMDDEIFKKLTDYSSRSINSSSMNKLKVLQKNELVRMQLSKYINN